MTIDCGRCEIRGIGCRDCAIAVIETQNVTGYLAEPELRALDVLADAGLVPPVRLTLRTRREARTWTSTVFPAVRTAMIP
jgi:hypothetical protein